MDVNKILSQLREDDFELYVQNILPGPLVIPDLGDMTLQQWEPRDLSFMDRKVLLSSRGLKKALNKGFLVTLEDRSEYEEQMDQYEARREEEYEDHLIEMEGDDLALNVDEIDLNSSSKGSYKRSSRDRRDELKKQRQGSMNDPEVYAKKFAEARDQYGIEDPEMFKEMVDNEQITIDGRGRKVRGVGSYDPEEFARQQAMERQAKRKSTVMTEDGPKSGKMGNYNTEGNLPGHEYRNVGFSDEYDGDGDEIEPVDLADD